jgi:1-acyl-sn-glycerol-3-phosphate acyltransferase
MSGSSPGPGREPWFGLLGAPGSPRAWWYFELAFRPWFRRQLAGIELGGVEAATRALGDEAPQDRARAPLLLVANHASWFDGFLLREVHRRVRPSSALRFIMLREELARSRTLRWIGGTGFDPGRPASLRGALAEVDALRGEGVTVAYFPQGKIYPSTRRPLGFHPGVNLAIRRLAPLTLLPVAIHLEPGNRLRPTAWLMAGPPRWIPGPGVEAAPPSAAALDAEIAGLLDRVQGPLHALGEDTPPLAGESVRREEVGRGTVRGEPDVRPTYASGSFPSNRPS